MFFIDILVTLIEVHYSRGASYRPASSSGLTRGSRRWLLGRRHLHSYLGFLRPALAYQRLDLRGSHGDRGPLGLHPTLLFHHWLPAMLEQQDGMDLMGRKESFLRSASEVSHVESVVSDNDEKRWLGYQFQVPVVETVTPHLAEEAAGGGI